MTSAVTYLRRQMRQSFAVRGGYPYRMAEQTPAPGNESAPTGPQTGIDAPRSLNEYIKTTAINTIPPLVAYYALRAFGTTPYLALAGAIVTAVLQGLLNMVRKRKFEPANGLVILGAACSLTIAFTTKNPRIVQVIELVPATVIVWSCLVSGLLRKPTSKKIASVVSPNLADEALPKRGWTEQDIQDWHGLHTRLCLWLGLLCGVFPVAAVFLIFTLPVDISLILINTIGPALLVVSIVCAVVLLRRFVRQRDKTAAERSVQPAEDHREQLA
jgi:hypothetical protein